MKTKNVKSLGSWALIGIAVSVGGCALQPEEQVSEAASALSVANWGATGGSVATTWRGSQVGTINGSSYVVSTGNCGLWTCWPYEDTDQLRYQRILGTGSPYAGDIAGNLADAPASLAPFNGFLYMVHSGTDGATTWISKFTPGVGWSPNSQIPYRSFGGPPAIVAYGNLLYFIGTGPYPYPMWYATMTAGEVFSAPVAIPGHDSASRPSAAVLWGKLYFAHRWGSTGDIVYGVYNGATWAPAAHIPGGASGGTLRGLEPSIAVDNGILHLVHQRPEGAPLVWWTYFDGCNWAPSEISIGTTESSHSPALSQGGPGLVMLTTSPNNSLFDENYGVYPTLYTHPYSPFPPHIPTCGIGILQ
jgi:hypothetical protein